MTFLMDPAWFPTYFNSSEDVYVLLLGSWALAKHCFCWASPGSTFSLLHNHSFLVGLVSRRSPTSHIIMQP